MTILLLIIAVISAVLLILVVMVQDEQGEGLGGIFGGGSSSPFGSRTGNVLTRITAILSLIFIVCTFVVALLNKTPTTDSTIDTAREDRFESGSSAGWYTKIQPSSENTDGSSSLYDTNPTTDGVETVIPSTEGEATTPEEATTTTTTTTNP